MANFDVGHPAVTLVLLWENSAPWLWKEASAAGLAAHFQCFSYSTWTKCLMLSQIFLSEMIFLPGFFYWLGTKINNMRNLHIIQSNFPFLLLPVFLSLVLKTLISLPALWGPEISPENEWEGKQRKRKIDIGSETQSRFLAECGTEPSCFLQNPSLP